MPDPRSTHSRPQESTPPSPVRALVVGASRGLGLVLVTELARRGWTVTATVRGPARELESHAAASDGRIEIETLEMTSDESLAALRSRLGARALDLLFVNAAIDRGDLSIAEVPTEMFVEVMVTNALAPMRVVEALQGIVAPDGTIAVMSSEQGSISGNTEEGFELYKASKAALNQLMRSYATRTVTDGRTLLLVDPGHNRTALGGSEAPLEPAESIPAVVDVLESGAHTPGLRFLDRFGGTVPW